MRTCILIAGGDVTGSIVIPEGALVLCADCGLRHAERLEIRPDVVIGDFDSYTETLPHGIATLRLPVEKDVTDTMQAVLYGAEQGCREFHIYGVFGGARIDHSLANIQMLHTMYTKGLHGILHHGTTLVTTQSPEDGTQRYPCFDGDFSIFAMTDTCEGVTIRGCKYNVEHITLRNSFPLGVSNSITAEAAEITVQTGLLLIVQVRKPSPNP
ncbi:MAG: thiamine diphosphokinase [Oscillospiraceae bacterium]|nr:thiamine diphosphokinase [Oscillospiraceae bacterium]